MRTWSFEEDYILCKVCDEHKYVFLVDELLDTLMNKLEDAGFAVRSRSAVRKRAHDCISLLCGQAPAHVPIQQKEICQWFACREQLHVHLEDVQSHLDKNNVRPVTIDLNTTASATPRSNAFLPIGSPEPKFQDLLIAYMNRKNMAETKVYKHAQIGRDTFSKIRTGKKGASKDTVMRLCFGLELTYDEAVAFMAKASYAFDDSDIRDLVIMYFLKNQIYTTYDVNAELYDRKERTLFDGRYPHYNIKASNR